MDIYKNVRFKKPLPFNFSSDECSKLKNGYCPMEEENFYQISEPTHKRDYECDMYYCYGLYHAMKKFHPEVEPIRLHKDEFEKGKIENITDGKHRLCISIKRRESIRVRLEE